MLLAVGFTFFEVLTLPYDHFNATSILPQCYFNATLMPPQFRINPTLTLPQPYTKGIA